MDVTDKATELVRGLAPGGRNLAAKQRRDEEKALRRRRQIERELRIAADALLRLMADLEPFEPTDTERRALEQVRTAAEDHLIPWDHLAVAAE